MLPLGGLMSGAGPLGNPNTGVAPPSVPMASPTPMPVGIAPPSRLQLGPQAPNPGNAMRFGIPNIIDRSNVGGWRGANIK